MKNLTYIVFILLISYSNSFSQWQDCNKGLPANEINCFAFDKNDIYLGNEQGLYYSTDNGASWNKKGFDNTQISEIFINENKIFVGTFEGMFLSTDNGKNWKNTGLEDAGFNKINVYKNKIYVSANIGDFVFVEKGQKWKKLKNSKEANILFSNEIRIISRIENDIMISNDGNMKWSKINSLPSNNLLLDIVFNGDNMFAVFEFDGIYKSKDLGKTWESKNSGLMNNCIQTIIDYNNIVIISTLDGLYFSKENAQNWIKIDSKINDVIEILKIKNDYIFAVTKEKGMFRAKVSDLIK